MKELLFVYGTLRKTQTAHRMLRRTRYIGLWISPPIFTMHHLGHFPGVVENGSTAITGEIYEVPALHFKEIDAFENAPYEFIRKRFHSPFGQCWMYLLNKKPIGLKVIRSGNWCKR